MFDNVEEPTQNKKRFYWFCKEQRKDQFGVPPLKSNGKMITDPKTKADVLNNHLSNVFIHKNCEDMPNKGESPFPTLNGVAKLRTSLNTAKASGPDCISANLLKLLVMALPLLTCPSSNKHWTLAPFQVNLRVPRWALSSKRDNSQTWEIVQFLRLAFYAKRLSTS